MASFKEIKEQTNTIREMCLKWKLSEGRGVLRDLLESQDKITLFPDDRIEYDWVPFRPIVSNLDKVLDNLSLILVSRNMSNEPLFTIGNCYKCPRGVKCSISLYGDIFSESLPGHLGRYIKQCLELPNTDCITKSVKCTIVFTHNDKTNYENISQHLNQCAFFQKTFFTSSIYCIEEDL